MDGKDWQDDVALTGRSATLSPLRQRQAGALALWRLRAPMFAFAWDTNWGLDCSVMESLFRSAVAAPGEQSDREYGQAIAELSRTPLFTSVSELDPDIREEVQLETIGSLLAFGETLQEPAPDRIEYVIDCPRGLADYVGELVEDSFYDHPSQDAHRQYLAALPERVRRYGLSYVGSLNLTVEDACHDALHTLPPGKGLLDTSTGRDLLRLCEDVGAELVAMLWWLRTTGH